MRKTNVERFKALGAEKTAIYAKKNRDYGDSFNDSLDEDGLLVAKIRLGDKYKRFSQLIKNPAEVSDESIRDTLVDLSNYADMTVMWMDEREAAKCSNPEDELKDFHETKNVFNEGIAYIDLPTVVNQHIHGGLEKIEGNIQGFGGQSVNPDAVPTRAEVIKPKSPSPMDILQECGVFGKAKPKTLYIEENDYAKWMEATSGSARELEKPEVKMSRTPSLEEYMHTHGMAVSEGFNQGIHKVASGLEGVFDNVKKEPHMIGEGLIDNLKEQVATYEDTNKRILERAEQFKGKIQGTVGQPVNLDAVPTRAEVITPRSVDLSSWAHPSDTWVGVGGTGSILEERPKVELSGETLKFNKPLNWD